MTALRVTCVLTIVFVAHAAAAQWQPAQPSPGQAIHYAGPVGVGSSTPPPAGITFDVSGVTRLQGNIFLGSAAAGIPALFLWPDTSGSAIRGTGAGIELIAMGGTIRLTNGDTLVQGHGTGSGAQALTVRGAGTTAATGAAQFLNASGATVLLVRNDGNVGIGTATPAERLEVHGNSRIVGDLTVTGNVAARYQDVAEWVPSAANLDPGSVVVLNPRGRNEVMASSAAYDTRVAGVVSAQPGVILGEAAADREMIATTGRVKVKVDATRAPIEVGDLLVTSDRPGLAMKSTPIAINGRKFHQPGTIIGKALEPLHGGTGEILVLLSLQ